MSWKDRLLLQLGPAWCLSLVGDQGPDSRHHFINCRLSLFKWFCLCRSICLSVSSFALYNVQVDKQGLDDNDHGVWCDVFLPVSHDGEMVRLPIIPSLSVSSECCLLEWFSTTRWYATVLEIPLSRSESPAGKQKVIFDRLKICWVKVARPTINQIYWRILKS